MPDPQRTFNYQVNATYTGTDNACTDAVYLLPPEFTYNQGFTEEFPHTTTAKSDDVFDNKDFSFEIKKPNKGGVIVTVKNKNLWKCDPAARQELAANFAAMLAALDAIEVQASSPLVPGATFAVGQRLAELLPASLAGSLFYRYSFEPGFASGAGPYVDLQPGMRLRVEFTANQFIGPGSAFNHLISRGQFTYDVVGVLGADGVRRLAFDAFLGSISAPDIANPSGSTTVAAGLMDLQAAGTARRYYRLCYPRQMVASDAIGDESITKNVTLIGADTLEDLENATTAYASGTCGEAATGNLPVQCFVFRGRTVVVPEIGVWVAIRRPRESTAQGTERSGTLWRAAQHVYVPVGTTVRHLAERFLNVPPAYYWTNKGTSDSPINLFLHRLQIQTATDKQWTELKLVEFNPGYLGLSEADVRTFDLPLVKGDRLTYMPIDLFIPST